MHEGTRLYRGLDYTDFVYRRHDLRCDLMLFIIYNPVQFILSRHFKRAFYSLFTLFITASFLGGLVNLIPFQTRTRSMCAWMGKTLVKVAYLRDARV